MCRYCEESKPMDIAVTGTGREVEAVGYYIIAGPMLRLFLDGVYLQDQIPVNYCPMCGSPLRGGRERVGEWLA